LSHPDQVRVKNRLLSALPAAEFANLAGQLTHVDLEIGQTLHRHGDVVEQVYFVETGFISAMTVLSDGHPLEIGLIGAEGLAGASVAMGAKTAYAENMCQTGGGAYRMPASTLKEAFDRSPAVRDLLLRYICVFNIQVAQTAACNAHHDLGQRLSRWLLAAHDRSGTPELSLTQDLISIMLGVRRSTVSVAAGLLQQAGVIRYLHGKITIIDRIGLENAACECYESVAGEYRRFFGQYSAPAAPVIRLVT
jgi:CRP-like cAMP-binding protein